MFSVRPTNLSPEPQTVALESHLDVGDDNDKQSTIEPNEREEDVLQDCDEEEADNGSNKGDDSETCGGSIGNNDPEDDGLDDLLSLPDILPP
jgi:hypothetical protein